MTPRAGAGNPDPGGPKRSGRRWVDSLAMRITVWYGMLLGLCLVAYSLAVGLSFERRMDRELSWRLQVDIELAARALIVDDEGRPRLAGSTLGRHVDEEETGGHWLEIWSPFGERLVATGTLKPPGLDPPTEETPLRQPRTLVLPAGPVREMTDILRFPGGHFLVRAAISEAGTRAQIRTVWRELLVLSAGVLFLGGLGGAALSRHSLKPLDRMADHARRITAAHLHERLPAQRTAELEELRQAFNAALEQLEGSFEQLRRFTADASHELRTPLTALRSVGEVGLRGATTADDAREVIGSMLEEVDRLGRLADELLTLARAEAGEAKLEKEPVDLSALARDVVGHLCVLAEEREQSLEAAVPVPVVATADRSALRQAVVNLVDNAIKYSPERSSIVVATGRRPGAVFIEVRDEGPGLDEVDRRRVFERFYRIDRSRSREMGGTGLGLSLVKWTAEAHDGSVELDTEVGRGSTFRLVLPGSAAGP
ncbi:MAG: HAMP domain-containing protein [Acidobacteria bacterium]|nr:HAMP domain-containing protein [Acidobacteriota bacterium]